MECCMENYVQRALYSCSLPRIIITWWKIQNVNVNFRWYCRFFPKKTFNSNGCCCCCCCRLCIDWLLCEFEANGRTDGWNIFRNNKKKTHTSKHHTPVSVDESKTIQKLSPVPVNIIIKQFVTYSCVHCLYFSLSLSTRGLERAWVFPFFSRVYNSKVRILCGNMIIRLSPTERQRTRVRRDRKKKTISSNNNSVFSVLTFERSKNSRRLTDQPTERSHNKQF